MAGSLGPSAPPGSPPPLQAGNSTPEGRLSSGIRWHRWLIGVVTGGCFLVLLILTYVAWRILRRKSDVKDPEAPSKGVINSLQFVLVLYAKIICLFSASVSGHIDAHLRVKDLDSYQSEDGELRLYLLSLK